MSAVLTNVTLAPPLLIVEDSDEDFETLQRLLRRTCQPIPLQRCVNGEQALDYLYRRGPYSEDDTYQPAMIILDLNLPRTDGRQVLQRIKQDETLRTIPVVVFTTSSSPRDIKECYEYGVNSYIVKPIDFSRLKQDIKTLVDYWFQVTTLPHRYPGVL
ncbi:MAG: response regulator [Cyanobacteria bacterium P01_A01_bin.135]